MLEKEFSKRTGTHRAGGALYMCAWRMENGFYDDKLRKSPLLLLVKYDTVRKAFGYKLLIFLYTVPLCIIL